MRCTSDSRVRICIGREVGWVAELRRKNCVDAWLGVVFDCWRDAAFHVVDPPFSLFFMTQNGRRRAGEHRGDDALIELFVGSNLRVVMQRKKGRKKQTMRGVRACEWVSESECRLKKK